MVSWAPVFTIAIEARHSQRIIARKPAIGSVRHSKRIKDHLLGNLIYTLALYALHCPLQEGNALAGVAVARIGTKLKLNRTHRPFRSRWAVSPVGEPCPVGENYPCCNKGGILLVGKPVYICIVAEGLIQIYLSILIHSHNNVTK